MATIVLGALAATAPSPAAFSLVKGCTLPTSATGRGLGKAILLGREFLVANDIIRTVAISPRASSYLP